jgi:hypothetical protein
MFKVVGVGALLVARAAFGDPYPEEMTDRPVVLNPGMTSLDANETFSSTSNGALRNNQFSFEADHAFGPVELDAVIGLDAVLQLEYATGGIPGAIYINATSGVPQSNNSLHEQQAIGAQHKVLVVPHAFALQFLVGVALNENRAFDDTWTHVLVPYAGATAEAQLAPFVAVIAGVSGAIPAQYSGPNVYGSTLSIGGGLIVTVDRDWDFYVHAGFDNVTRSIKYPYIDTGISRRFGR